MSDAFDLDRFVSAQDSGGAYAAAVAELERGRKTGHWIWFVLPQVAGLGSSGMSRRFAISGIAEARAYLAHPVLGFRLREVARVVANASAQSAEALLGSVDAVKLRSSMTLFAAADPADPLFAAVLERWFAGERDPATLARL